MRLNKAAILAWLFCGVIVVAWLVRVWGQWSSGNGGDNVRAAAMAATMLFKLSRIWWEGSDRLCLPSWAR